MEITDENLAFMREVLIQHVPHARAVGLDIVSVQKNECRLCIPYDEKLIGNPDTRVIHGGVITTLLDNACGVAVQLSLPERQSIATLDLRIDYMRPAVPDRDLIGHAHCYKITKNIAFVRGTAYHDDETDPIATCVGAFMLAANRTVPLEINDETRALADVLLEAGKEKR